MKTASAYAEFLKTTFWKELSLRVRRKFGFRCQRCWKLDHCQAHHKFYREDWNQTQEGDLECICRACHEKEHGIVVVSMAIPAPVVIESTPPRQFPNWGAVKQARRAGTISRSDFVRLKRSMKPKKKRRRRRPKPNAEFRPVYYTKGKRPHWVNRGGTSN